MKIRARVTAKYSTGNGDDRYLVVRDAHHTYDELVLTGPSAEVEAFKVGDEVLIEVRHV